MTREMENTMTDENSRAGKTPDLANELGISRDNPRILQDKTGARSRCADPQEYHTLTSAMGYRDVTEAAAPSEPSAAAPDSETSSASSGTASGSGARSARNGPAVTGATAPGAPGATGGSAGTGGDA